MLLGILVSETNSGGYIEPEGNGRILICNFYDGLSEIGMTIKHKKHGIERYKYTVSPWLIEYYKEER